MRKLLKNKTLALGLLLYIGVWLFTIVGTIYLPFNPNDHEPIMANLPPSKSYLNSPIDLEPKDIKMITNGTSFSLALLNNGSVVSWGDDEEIINEVENIDKNIQQIAAGARHVVAIDKDNELIEFGEVTSYQKQLSSEQKKMMQEEGVQTLFASDTFSGCLTTNGYLYYWGNTASLAMNDITNTHQGHITKVVVNPFHLLYMLDDGTLHMVGREDELSEIPESINNGNIRIKDMYMNYTTVMILDDNNQIHMWGEEVYDLPKHNRVPIQIVSGRRNFHILYEDGTVDGLGENAKSDENVQMLYSNYFQTYAIHENSIQSWGNDGFLLGSDEYGRDILTRLVHGGLISLVIGLPACILSCFLSIFFGLLSGYCGGKIDHYIMRLSECISSIPFLPLIITLSAFLIKDTNAYLRLAIVMLLYGCLSWPSLARLIRSKVMVEKKKDYILYEESVGASNKRILWKHIFPSTFSILAADITMLYASTLLIEASLSFLGFGVPAMYPSWGNMLESARTIQVIQLYWWRWLFAAICIFISVLSVHLISEAIRKQINPKE